MMDTAIPSELVDSPRGDVIEALRQRLGNPKGARASWDTTVSVMEPIAAGSVIVEHLTIYATALLHLEQVDRAQPVVANLLETDRRDRTLLNLCAKHGLCQID